MKFVALKELPQGQQPGEEFEAHEAVGDILVMVGAARKVVEPRHRAAIEPAAVAPVETTGSAEPPVAAATP